MKKLMSRRKMRKSCSICNLRKKDNDVIEFLDAVNNHLKVAMETGDLLCLVESMVKAFHKNLKGKMKIIKKLHPIGNEFKTVCGPRPKMVFYDTV